MLFKWSETESLSPRMFMVELLFAPAISCMAAFEGPLGHTTNISWVFDGLRWVGFLVAQLVIMVYGWSSLVQRRRCANRLAEKNQRHILKPVQG